MSGWQVYLTVSGSGERFNVGEPVATLEEATKVVQRLDERWFQLDQCLSEDESQDTFQEKYDALPENDPLRHYEGCDLYAEHPEHGTRYVDGEFDHDHIQWREL